MQFQLSGRKMNVATNCTFLKLLSVNTDMQNKLWLHHYFPRAFNTQKYAASIPDDSWN